FSFFFSSRRRHTRSDRDWSSDVCSSDLKKNELPVTIYSDSQYVINTVQKGWLKNWIRTDFAGGKKNKDLWKHYHELAKKFSITRSEERRVGKECRCRRTQYH